MAKKAARGLSPQEKFADARAAMVKSLIERHDEIDMVLTALLCREHPLFVGPPGTAKSLLIDSLMRWLEGSSKKFSVLLNKASMPDEVYGPLNIIELKNGKFVRVMHGKLPEADFAFLDEALAIDTPILTPTGWSCMGDLQEGDYVFGCGGKPVKVLATTPIVNGDCYRITFRDTSTLIADAGHLWKVTNEGGTIRVVSTKYLAERIENRTKAGKRNTLILPKSEPVQFPEQNLTIDPYTLGVWLGNGNRWGAEVYIRDVWAMQTLEEIQKVYPNARIYDRETTSEAIYVISLADTGFRTLLREAGLIQSPLYGSKGIPEEYLMGSVSQRLALLQGLMDTDGYIGPEGTCTFTNTNENIIDGLVFLVRSLGIRCSGKELRSNDKGNTWWHVNFRANPNLNPFRCREMKIPKLVQSGANSILSIEKVDSVPVRCITVDSEDHLFLAGESLVVTHNCFKASTTILNSMLKILNERLYDKGDGEVLCPLKVAIAASNEWPDAQELGALFDRFLLRKTVKQVSKIGRRRLLRDRSHAPSFTSTISVEELDQAHDEAMALEFSDQAWATLDEMLDELNREGILPGDRRMKKATNIARAFAYLRGANEVEPVHLEVLKYVLWSDAGEQEKKCHQIVSRLSNPIGSKITDLLMQAASVVEVSKPEEAVSKLQAIQKEIAGLPDHERRDPAHRYVGNEIKQCFNRVIGYEEVKV